MRTNIIVASLASPNPDIRVKMSWLKTNLPQGMILVCMPPITDSLEIHIMP